MMRRFLLSVFGLLVLAAPTPAFQNPAPRPVAAPQAPPAPAPAGPAKPETVPVNEAPATRLGVLANVRLDVTITDQRASGQPTSKTVSLVLADRANGRIRTAADVRVPTGHGNSQMRSVVLNVDAHPEFTRDGRVRAQVTLEYRPVAADAPSEDQALTTISESFAVILEDGKPLMVSQSADQSTDRRVRVELKATILK